MNNDIAKDDMQELERRRLTEAVTESVETTLRKRYTWLAIVASFLIGGGAGVIVHNVMGSARNALIKTELRLEDAQMLLEQAEISLEEVDKLAGSVKKKLDELNREAAGASAGSDTLRVRLEETTRVLQEQESRIEELTQTVNMLVKKEPNITAVPTVQESKQLAQTVQRIELSKYRVYLHYSKDQDRASLEALSERLKKEGYVVPRIQEVESQGRNIRYFHDEDRPAAESLKLFAEDILKKTPALTDIDFKLRDYGLYYPDVRNGLLELWL